MEIHLKYWFQTYIIICKYATKCIGIVDSTQKISNCSKCNCNAEMDSESCQASKMKRFSKIVPETR